MTLLNPAMILQIHIRDLNLEIVPANVFELARLSDIRGQRYIKSNSKNMFSSNFEDFEFNTSPEDAFKNLAISIATFSNKLKFNLMALPPKSVICSNLNIVDNIIVRSIEYYEVRIDEILTRYDVLVEKVI